MIDLKALEPDFILGLYEDRPGEAKLCLIAENDDTKHRFRGIEITGNNIGFFAGRRTEEEITFDYSTITHGIFYEMSYTFNLAGEELQPGKKVKGRYRGVSGPNRSSVPSGDCYLEMVEKS